MKNRILITGATGGIGEALSFRLAEDGYDLALHFGTNINKAQEIKSEIEKRFSSHIELLQFDVRDTQKAQNKLEDDMEKNGVYYGVICNAGIHKDMPFVGMEKEDWDSVLNINMDSIYNILKPVMLPMIRRRKPGRIITLSSIAGEHGNRGQSNYSSAKAAIIGFTKSLALELAKRQITVNCISPGVIETEMTKNLDIDMLKKMIPAGRLGKASEVAALASFIMGEESAYITKQVFSINGGMA